MREHAQQPKYKPGSEQETDTHHRYECDMQGVGQRRPDHVLLVDEGRRLDVAGSHDVLHISVTASVPAAFTCRRNRLASAGQFFGGHFRPLHKENGDAPKSVAVVRVIPGQKS
jgi:hypothetical protein